MKTKPGGPFHPEAIERPDIESLENFYLNNGFPEAQIVFEFSPGEKKKLQISIKENGRKLVGEPDACRRFPNPRKDSITSLFPLKPGQPFNREKMENFKADIDSSSIFNEVRVESVGRTSNVNDILIKATPDGGGFSGSDWDGRSGERSPRYVRISREKYFQLHIIAVDNAADRSERTARDHRL